MAFPTNQLNAGEDVVLDLNPHWWFMAKQAAALFGATVLGVVVLFTTDAPTAVNVLVGLIILAALVWFGKRYLEWTTTNFVVTSDRLVYRYGIIAKNGIEIPLDRVNTVIFAQTVFERLLGAGDLTIESAGENGQQKFSDVRKPSAVQNEIYRQIEANENRKYDRIGSNAASASSSASSGEKSSSVADELAKLDDLRRRGVISEEEFEAQKRRLLG